MKAPSSRLLTNLGMGIIVLILLAQFWIFSAALEMAHDPAHEKSSSLLVISGMSCAAVWVLIACLNRTEHRSRKPGDAL